MDNYYASVAFAASGKMVSTGSGSLFHSSRTDVIFLSDLTVSKVQANSFVTECSTLNGEVTPTVKLSYNDRKPDNVRIAGEEVCIMGRKPQD